MVWPSGSDLATILAPMVPPAPGRFSITKVCPTCFPTCSKTTRAMTSLATPAGIGRMTVTLRDGQSCATADVSAAIDRIAPSAARRMMLFMVAPPACTLRDSPWSVNAARLRPVGLLATLSFVIAGLDPAIHDDAQRAQP